MVLQHLRPLVHNWLAPLQSAYSTDIAMEDAIIYLLHRAYKHLERPQSMVRITFFDFSNAFDMVQPVWLAEKLSVIQADPNLVAWITDIPRPGKSGCNTACQMWWQTKLAHQGTVLSLFLYTLYTCDFCYKSQTCHLQKYSTYDDSSYSPSTHVSITWEGVEMMDTYRFLEVHLNNKLNWSDNNDSLYRRRQSRQFFQRRLRSLNACTRLLHL